jgi:hypothetical protein
MKKLTLCFALLCLTNQIFAQATNLPVIYLPTALVYTNNFADNATNATASGALDCRRDRYLGWQISYNLSGSGTAVNYFDFERSLDNTNWPGWYFTTVPLAANGTSTVLTNLTMDLEVIGFVRLSRVRFGNNSGSYPTNLSLLYTPKPYVR